MVTEHLGTAWQELVVTLTHLLPRLVLGVVVTVVLLLAAKLVRHLTAMACRHGQVDRLSASLGLEGLVARLGVRQPASTWIPGLVYAGTLLLFAQTGATILGLTPIADSIRALFSYVPSILAAVAVLLAGSAAAAFAGQAVRHTAEDSGIDLAPTLGSLTSTLVLLVTGIMALSQLRIDTDTIRIVTVCVLGGIALAFGLSLGLGSRDITRNMIAGFYARKVLRPGDIVRVGEHEGVLVTITPTQTVIALPADEEVAVSNGAFLETGPGITFTAIDRPHER